MKKAISILTILVTLTLISGCVVVKHDVYDAHSQTFYNENNKENYFTLYPNDVSFIYIELKKDGSQTFDLSKAGNYKRDEDTIFLIVPQGIVLRGKFVNEITIIDSEGTKWIKKQ